MRSPRPFARPLAPLVVIRPQTSRHRAPRRLLVALAVAATLSAAATALGACSPRGDLRRFEQLEFRTSLVAFADWWIAAQASRHHVSPFQVRRWLELGPERLDDAASRRGSWDLSTDLCSRVPDRGPSFDFRWACIRHDFAWRNARRLLVDRSHLVRVHRRADRRFLEDMRTHCRARPPRDAVRCQAQALAYFLGVELVA